MAYASLPHVVARNPQRGDFTPNTKPTASQVCLFIEEAQAEVDTVLLAAGYALPIATDAASSARMLLQQAVSAGAAYKAEWAAAVSDRRKEYEDMWQSALRMLKVTQLDMPKDAGESLPRGPRQGFSGATTTAQFTRDMVL